MLDTQMPVSLTVYAELIVAELAVPMTSSGGEGPVEKSVAIVGHVAREDAWATLCHRGLGRFQRCPQLQFSPRPLGMERCSVCFSAYARLLNVTSETASTSSEPDRGSPAGT